MRRKKHYTLTDVRQYTAKTMNFTGPFADLVGCPELKGTWIIWGDSSNGKTSFALQLAMYMTNFTKVAYDSIEEGMSKSMQDALARIPLDDKAKYRFTLLDNVDIESLKTILTKKRSPNVVFIDSLQYTGMNYTKYKELRDMFPTKLFVFISHADGNLPKGEVAKSVRYDSFVKISVSNYVATANSRYGGGTPYVIWQEGARKYGKKQKEKEETDGE